MGNIFTKKTLVWVGSIILMFIALVLSVGINDAGHRTVVQHLNGNLDVVFKSGPYMQWAGKTTEYKDVLTFDFDKTENEEGVTIDQDGISVRYQDGGEGTIFGIGRYSLPNDIEHMLKVHREFRSNDGIAYKIVKPITEEISNHTAGLMSSEESYTDRGTFTTRAKTQLTKGKYVTVQFETITTEAGMEYCLEANLTPGLKRECKNVKKTTKLIPKIAKKDGLDLHATHDFDQYGIRMAGFTLVDWTYEPKTMKQISDKREATMAIITSKANAERAKQDAITAEQQGLANVKKAEYEKEVEKIREVVDAEKAKEVAVIKAKQRVDVAVQNKLTEEQNKLAAYETKKKDIALGQGEAERKKLVMLADGALQQKLDAWVQVNKAYAAQFSKQKWVPEIQMGVTGEGGNGAAAMIDLLSTQAAKQLSLDMKMKK